MQWDGVIAGAGAAGMLAALRAADAGAEVALLDGADADQSNLAASSGMFSAAGTRFQAAAGIEDSPARWAQDITRKTAGAVDPAILASVTGRSADVAHFMADRIGLPLRLMNLTLPGHTAARLHTGPAASGAELAAMLFAAVQRFPKITVMRQTRVNELIVEQGRVCGVQTSAGPVRGRLTLLASGGFAANREVVARNAPEILGAVNIGRGPNDGWALRAGEALGGTLMLMDSYQGQGHATPDGLGRLGTGLAPYGAIVVNADGRRFADEAMGPSEFGAFVLAQPGGAAVELFDRYGHDEAWQLSSYRAVSERGLIEQVDTLDAVAARFGLPADALRQTMQTWAESVAGAPDPFGRRIGLRTLLPPYLAARVTGALAHTQGGLLVDVAARVIRADGVPIPGLLAAGGAVASISGHGAAGYLPGNGLGHAFTLGMIAGETIASSEQLAGETP